MVLFAWSLQAAQLQEGNVIGGFAGLCVLVSLNISCKQIRNCREPFRNLVPL